MLACGPEVRNISSWYVSFDGKQYPAEHSEQKILGASGPLTNGDGEGGGVKSDKLPAEGSYLANGATGADTALISQRWIDTISQNG